MLSYQNSENAPRDTYFYDVCREIGIDPTDPADWVTLGIVFQDTNAVERFAETR